MCDKLLATIIKKGLVLPPQTTLYEYALQLGVKEDDARTACADLLLKGLLPMRLFSNGKYNV